MLTLIVFTLVIAVVLAGCATIPSTEASAGGYPGLRSGEVTAKLDEIKGACPVVVSTDPLNKAVNVALDKVISVTFNTAMNPSSINNTTFTIMQGSTSIAGTVAPTANNASRVTSWSASM